MFGSDGNSRDRRRARSPKRTFEVHAFLGAGVLVAALLIPHARVLPVGGGIALAGVLRWSWLRITR
jgi:hypothetical protein